MNRLLASFLLLTALALDGCGSREPPVLEALPLAPRTVTVSGMSSGGYMAVQFHVAHSELVSGAGVIAGGPYYCSEGSMMQALGRCMRGGEGIPTDKLISITSQLALEGAIDPIADLANDRVWLFHGAADPFVAKSVVDALQAYYTALVDPTHVSRVEHPDAAHTFPTVAAGSACSETRSPYLGACKFDGAGKLLEHLYGRLEPRGEARTGKLIEFDQRPYARQARSVGLADRGWVFMPKQCQSRGGEPCRLHVVFHGCRQGASNVDDKFVRGSGYLEWAATNGIVVLFPQIEPSYRPLNGFGCWDFWGYENEDYLTKDGPQVRAVRLMIARLRGEAWE